MKPVEPFLKDLEATPSSFAESLFVRVLAAGVLWAAVVGIVWYALEAVLAL